MSLPRGGGGGGGGNGDGGEGDGGGGGDGGPGDGGEGGKWTTRALPVIPYLLVRPVPSAAIGLARTWSRAESSAGSAEELLAVARASRTTTAPSWTPVTWTCDVSMPRMVARVVVMSVRNSCMRVPLLRALLYAICR